MYKEICSIYTIDYHSAIKKNYILSFGSNMDRPREHYGSEMTEKVRYHMIPSYLWSMKTKQNRKPKQKFIDAENRLVVLGGGGWG